MFVATMAEEDCREDFMSFTLFQKVFYFGIFLFGWPLLMIVE